MTLSITIQNQIFILHQSGTIFWQAKKTLLISDVHMGKVAHFRQHGIAIPELAVHGNLERLDEIMAFFNPEKIIFLGDLFHSKINTEWELFTHWVKSTTAEILLVEGNHDIIAKENYTLLEIKIFESLTIDGFLLTHHPTISPGFFNFCGHIHPGIKLYDVGRQPLRLPCFFQKPDQMILPAFGEFTGNHYLKPSKADKVYVITESEVIPIA